MINANLTANATSADSTGTAPVGSDSARLLAYFYIAIAFGLSLFGIASIFYRFTGSIMNPSVSLALVLVGVIKPVRFVSECGRCPVSTRPEVPHSLCTIPL